MNYTGFIGLDFNKLNGYQATQNIILDELFFKRLNLITYY